MCIQPRLIKGKHGWTLARQIFTGKPRICLMNTLENPRPRRESAGLASRLKDPIINEDLDAIRRAIDPSAFRGKSVIVSGGSGFLGSWICDTLVGLDSRIICLDNLSTGVFENIDHLKTVKNFKFERADVCTYSKNPKVDMVFHLASRPAPEDYQKHPVETALANATGTDRMLDLARKNDARVLMVRQRDGSQTRSFSYVTDTVSASLLFMGLDRSSEKVLNIGTKEERKIRDLAERIKAIAVSDSTIRFLPLPAGDHMRRLPDTRRVEKLLGWSPSIRLETGLDRTLRWFRSKTLR